MDFIQFSFIPCAYSGLLTYGWGEHDGNIGGVDRINGEISPLSGG